MGIPRQMGYAALVQQVIMIMLSRRFDAPITQEQVRDMMADPSWADHQVQYLTSYLANDGLSTLCVFQAAHAKAVRVANDQAGLPVEKIWPVSEHLGDGVASIAKL